MLRCLSSLTRMFVRPRRGAEHGGVAVNFALLALPLAVMSFGLVDVNRASVEKRRLQDALDAATLAAARSSAVLQPELQVVGQKVLNANLAAMSDATLQSSTFGLHGSKVTGNATAKITPIVANLWLQGDMTVSATSEVVRSMNKVEVVLVLDTTGSMAGTKLNNLKLAATNFVNTLAAASLRSVEVDPVKIGIVPFSSTVRIGSSTSEINSYKNASWMDKGTAPIGADIFNGRTGVNRFTLFSGLNQNWGGCVESRAMPYDVQETAPTASNPATLYTPFFWPDEADTDYYALNNYLGDGSYTSQTAVTSSSDWRRRQGYAGKYSSNASFSTSSGPNKGCDMQSLVRLTTDWDTLLNKITLLNASGETHIPVGLAWGWNVLSPTGPFGDGVPYSTAKTQKIVVLMTDGENTYMNTNSANNSYYDAYSYIWANRMGTTSSNAVTRTTAIDNRMSILCSNMKSAGIVIYTVRVEVTSGSSSLLQGCATKADMFYDVQNAGNLTAVFSAIAGSIENLRLSK